MKHLRLAPANTKISFMRGRRVSYPLSACLSLIAVAMFFLVGMNFGIDFAGGTQVEMRAKSGAADLATLRTKAEGLGLGPVEAQRIGAESDVTLRLNVQPGGEQGQTVAVNKLHKAFDADYEFRSVETVGPRVSGELVQSGTLGIVVAILAVLTYLWFRFEWQFAVGAIIGTMHDLLLTVGFFSVTQLEFNATSIAAILTVVGYSLNETVIVLDRIREVMRKYKKLSTAEIIDMSINAVLPRTIMTATTVFLALLALFFLGGHVIRSFSAAMIWGIFVATYSSIFICSPMLIYMGVRADTFDKNIEKTRRGAGARRPVMAAAPREKNAFAPGAHVIEAYGAGGFRFAGLSHVGSILATPKGVSSVAAASLNDLDASVFARLFAELDETPGLVEFVVIGSGAKMAPFPRALAEALRARGVHFEVMATGPAIRVYNVMIDEGRRVATLLMAAP